MGAWTVGLGRCSIVIFFLPVKAVHLLTNQIPPFAILSRVTTYITTLDTAPTLRNRPNGTRTARAAVLNSWVRFPNLLHKHILFKPGFVFAPFSPPTRH